VQSSPSEEAVGAFLDRQYKARAEVGPCWGIVVDKCDAGEVEQIPVFGKVELIVMYEMDGGTLNRVTDGNPAIFDVGSSKRDIE
jgi:hypothetical protein